MDIFSAIEKIRRKPVEVRRKFAAISAIIVMGVVTAIWFIFFVSGIAKHFDQSKANSDTAAPVEEGTPASVDPTLAPPTFLDIPLPGATSTEPE